jgi:hypothetical protein
MLKMEIICSSETSVDIQRTTWKSLFLGILATDNGLPSNIRFSFEVNIVKIYLMWESMCEIYIQTFLYLQLSELTYLKDHTHRRDGNLKFIQPT